jgi:hypothetical protein
VLKDVFTDDVGAGPKLEHHVLVLGVQQNAEELEPAIWKVHVEHGRLCVHLSKLALRIDHM